MSETGDWVAVVRFEGFNNPFNVPFTGTRESATAYTLELLQGLLDTGVIDTTGAKDGAKIATFEVRRA